jgi:type VI protein secretion system component Hcp
MAIDAYMCFQLYDNKYLPSESQVDLRPSNLGDEKIADPFMKAAGDKALFEIEDYSFDIEQVLNIGSPSTGAGAGKVIFNAFSITRKIDKSSTRFFEMACSGTPFKSVFLGMRKSAGGEASGVFFLRFQFKLVAVKTVSWAHDDESPKETVTFEYGGLILNYGQQEPSGKIMPAVAGGWNRVKNVADVDPDKLIT